MEPRQQEGRKTINAVDGHERDEWPTNLPSDARVKADLANQNRRSEDHAQLGLRQKHRSQRGIRFVRSLDVSSHGEIIQATIDEYSALLAK
jgi:hypothetical protein